MERRQSSKAVALKLQLEQLQSNSVNQGNRSWRASSVGWCSATATELVEYDI